MRILHLIPTFNGGGAERQMALMARHHAENGADVAIIYHGEGPNFELLKNSNVTLFPLILRGNHDPMALLKIVRTIRNWKPNIVQTWLQQMDILGGLAAHATGVPHILSERSSSQAYGNGWKSRLRRAIGQKATAIIANSQSGAHYWREQVGNGAVHVVANAVTPLSALTTGAMPAIQRPAILFAGRIAPPKNLANMIAGIGLALERSADAHAYILGSGHQETELRQWIDNTRNPGRIHFVGYTKSLFQWYAKADVFVSVSDFEGHPNVVLEAASIGCPMVLSNIPEHREAIPADGALFVDGHEPVEIANALLATLADRDASEARARNSQHFVAELSLEKQAAKYLEIYAEIVGSN